MSAMCPVTHGFTPFDSDFVVDPYPFYNRLRDETRVAYAPEYDVYLVTRHADIVAVLKDRDTFSAANSTIPFRPIAPLARKILDSGFPRKPTFSNADAPRHTKMRSAASKCLTRKRWATVQPTLREFVEQRIDVILEKDVSDLGEDLIFATTSLAGFTLLGFPLEDTKMLQDWCNKRILLTYGELSEDEQAVVAQQLVDFWSYCRDFVRLRQRQPADDLTTDLLALSRELGDELTLEDVDNMVYSLSLASHETTANSMLNGLHRLMRNRDVWNELVRDPQLVPGAVEELLRMDSPTVTHRRLATRNTEIAGVPIPAGATVMLVLASGNHDPEHFPDPERVDIRRKNALEHLAFGKHWHFCLGAPLARFEYGLVLERLLARMPKMTLVPDVPVQYMPVILMRGPDRLMVHPTGRA